MTQPVSPPLAAVADAEAALAEAAGAKVAGPAVTPFVLSVLHERSGGRTLTVNRELVGANAQLAAEIAVAYARNG